MRHMIATGLLIGLAFGLAACQKPSQPAAGDAPIDQTGTVERAAPEERTGTVERTTPEERTGTVERTAPEERTGTVERSAPVEK